MRPGRRAIAATLGRRRASALRQFVRAAVLLGALVFSFPVSAEAAGDSRVYRLAPGDRIAVMVFGQAELSGDILVDGAGNILLPFIGPIEVKGLTVDECQQRIHDQLANGILKQPSVSVRVSELRPLYVLGDVRVPGVYPFRYGSTVKSVVAAAGGFGLAEQGATISDFLLADERVRQLSLQKQSLLVRRARIEAQRDGMNAFSPSAARKPAEEADFAETVAGEKETFDSQLAMLQSQLDLLRSQKPRIQKEIEAHNGLIATNKRQLEDIKEHAEQYGKLVKQGLGLANAELQLRITEANYENELWKLTAQVSRLEMDNGDLDLKIQETEVSFKKQILVELRDVREHLRELDVTLPSARKIRAVKLQQISGFAGNEAARSISVTRARDGAATVFQATETTSLEPGDVIDVKRLLPPELTYQGPSASESGLRPSQTGEAGPERPVASASR
ncbi:polysaccharide export outer membrane protein [Bradyrhizobium erythrophlei]|uniref:Polysaccharide export outer membrane protein n=1 Tax=Bradyrhizobium erythrophlei TaxID=1437360 RepID=A0A1M5Q6P9_9BRAD|nr:polysaccharide export outer membrane protein [Bradyrhizobium erythrophlei]